MNPNMFQQVAVRDLSGGDKIAGVEIVWVEWSQPVPGSVCVRVTLVNGQVFDFPRDSLILVDAVERR